MAALESGAHVGSYEIVAAIGAGGMGEVYSARDTKLKRDVAIKVLPQDFSRQPERVARFQREAESLAALNHPNIAQVYGVEESRDTRCIVMELVGGETLAERLLRGPIPLDEALDIAKQIAEALEAAHEKGIIHRDLKPANVKVTPEGRVKVLDFGLARALDNSGSGILSHSPTMMTAMPAGSAPGVILGTAAYMSPEQARGKAVDRRADIWAFGCVLFEMLSGRQAFSGETVTDIIARIVRDEPDWALLSAETSLNVRTALKRCLTKDVRQRFHDIADVRIELETPAEPNLKLATPVSSKASKIAWGMAAVSTIALLVVAIALWPADSSSSLGEVQFSFDTVSNFQRQFYGPAIISPDGRRIVFIGEPEPGGRSLVVRDLKSLETRRLEGARDAVAPFWSPDGNSIAYFTTDKLNRISADGGPAQTICDVRGVGQRTGAWSPDDVILFSEGGTGALWQVSAAGGPRSPATTLDEANNEVQHSNPQFLPDGRQFLFSIRNSKPENSGLYVASLASGGRRRITNVSTRVRYSPTGHLIFARDRTIVAQAFDLKTVSLSGSAQPIGGPLFGPGAFSVSDNGVLAYRSEASLLSELTWYDRSGRKIGTVGQPAEYVQMALSPDGKHVVYSAIDGAASSGQSSDIWLLELARGISTRLTRDPRNDNDAVWSPDSKQIVFASNRTSASDIYLLDTTDTTGEKELWKSDAAKFPESWTPDGQSLIYISGNGLSFFRLSLAGEPKAIEFMKTAYDKDEPAVSPDSRWIAYTSNESGTFEVYVEPFMAAGRKQRISVDGGGKPLWRKDGKELFYLALDGTLMAVGLKGGETFIPESPKPLFQTGVPADPLRDQYSVTADGQRFLVMAPAGDTQPPRINVIINWAERLKN